MDAQLEGFPGLIEHFPKAVSGELILPVLQDGFGLTNGIEDERLFLFEPLLALPRKLRTRECHCPDAGAEHVQFSVDLTAHSSRPVTAPRTRTISMTPSTPWMMTDIQFDRNTLDGRAMRMPLIRIIGIYEALCTW